MRISMKHLTLISLILILTACGASAPTIVAETVTLPPASTQTVETIATYTPEPTATITPTATEARDPSIPAEYTKDASGKYTKIENGITVTWDPERNAGYSLMFDNFMWDLVECSVSNST
jgi:ABC-type glycerol-3-phosphate transport system substrate-binding protein